MYVSDCIPSLSCLDYMWRILNANILTFSICFSYYIQKQSSKISIIHFIIITHTHTQYKMYLFCWGVLAHANQDQKIFILLLFATTNPALTLAFKFEFSSNWLLALFLSTYCFPDVVPRTLKTDTGFFST